MTMPATRQRRHAAVITRFGWAKTDRRPVPGDLSSARIDLLLHAARTRREAARRYAQWKERVGA